jgi:hypothetical protein
VEDIRDGYQYYEEQQAGLGSYFAEKIYAAIELLGREAGIHPLQFGSFHRKLVRRFPFAIYYRFGEIEIAVYAVIDCRRAPNTIRARLRKAAKKG